MLYLNWLNSKFAYSYVARNKKRKINKNQLNNIDKLFAVVKKRMEYLPVAIDPLIGPVMKLHKQLNKTTKRRKTAP